MNIYFLIMDNRICFSLLFYKRDPFYMFSNKDTRHIPGFIPSRFTGHIVCNKPPVYSQVFERDISHLPIAVITGNYRHLGVIAIITYIPEMNILDSHARGFAILLVIKDANINELSLSEIFNPDVLEEHVADNIIITAIDGKATLVIELCFFMV